jgi:hypothetical protein
MSIKYAFCLGGVSVLALWSAGCGASTGTVSGKVTYQGETLGGGSVLFVSPGKKTVSAPIGPDGTYTIVGIPAGPVQIAVETKSAMPPDAKQQAGMAATRPTIPPDANLPPSAKEMYQNSTAAAAAKYVEIPEELGDPDKSNLTLTVTGGNQDYNIELK